MSNVYSLRVRAFDTWQGFDWLIPLAVVVWVLASFVAVLFLVAYAMSDGGAELELYGMRRAVCLIAANTTLFVVPIGVGLLARAAGFTHWLWALFLLPHSVVATVLIVRGAGRLR
jgi:hypothetical protein